MLDTTLNNNYHYLLECLLWTPQCFDSHYRPEVKKVINVPLVWYDERLRLRVVKFLAQNH